MTTTLTIRLPVRLARDLKAKTRLEKTTPTEILRKAAESYLKQKASGNSLNAVQQHILARAGTWDGICSGEELLKRTRP